MNCENLVNSLANATCSTFKRSTLIRIALAPLLLMVAVGLNGCQITPTSAPAFEPGVTGSVFGGQQPVTGSLIQLYAVGTAGDGSAAKPLILTTVTTSDGSGLANSNANAGNVNNTLPAGSFTITGAFTCPSAATEVYLVSTGGNPGLPTPTNNPSISLMAALGPCGSLSSSTYIAMNELTTVGMVASLQNFIHSYSSVGSSSSDLAQLQTAFLAANQYANTTTGTVPGPIVQPGYSAPSSAIATLADILATCINSAGGAAGDSTACGQLFSLTKPSAQAAPTDTVGALLNILNQPAANVSSIYALLDATPPFGPTLPSAPASWALPLTSTTSTPLTYSLLAFPETDNSVTPLYAFINSAQKTIDMTMYELQDPTFSSDLVAACTRGVKVRVLLSSSQKSNNATAYAAINAGGSNCSAVYSNSAFTHTHQKTITVDNAQTAIMSLNLQTQYYSTTRDFAMIENDAADIAAIEATFAQDYAAAGTNSSADFNYLAPSGDDLIWSPTTAQAAMTSIIANAKSTLLIENEEMASSASYIITALATACQNGVTVHIAMEYSSSYVSGFNTLKSAGCKLSTYNNPNGFYIHAKAVVADYGLSTQKVYMGSINYSNGSMNMNRELGVYITDPTSVQFLNATMTSDFAGASPY